jgi:hypothetical protein
LFYVDVSSLFNGKGQLVFRAKGARKMGISTHVQANEYDVIIAGGMRTFLPLVVSMANPGKVEQPRA